MPTSRPPARDLVVRPSISTPRTSLVGPATLQDEAPGLRSGEHERGRNADTN
jgi:hypothetical protein